MASRITVKIKEDQYKNVLALAMITIAGALSVAAFFRYQILNGFTVLNGNRYETGIELSLLEHWRNTFAGLSHWSEPNYFYPAKDTLGYNDGYFLYGLIHSVLRGVGLDPFLSVELVNVVIRTIGFVAFYLAARRVVRFQVGWALLGAIVFTVSNNIFSQMLHAQLLSVSFVPAMAVLIDGLIASLRRGDSRKILIWGVGASIFYAAWLMTAFYMAWYLLFFSVFLFLAYLFVRGAGVLRSISITIAERPVLIFTVAAILVLINLPFLSVYLPKVYESGAHPYANVQGWEPSPLDALNVGAGNLLYGAAWVLLNQAIRPGYSLDWSEQITGVPPLLLSGFIVGFALLLVRWRKDNYDRSGLLLAIAVATVGTWALTIKIDGWSPWWFVYEYFPGGKATRIVARYQIFLTFPVIIIALYCLSSIARNVSKPVMGMACVLLVVEQLNTAAQLGLDRPAEQKRLASVSAPPRDCHTFFAIHKRPGTLPPKLDAIYSNNIDAMIIAEELHIPTINGIATFFPSKWDLFDSENPTYISHVRSYAENHSLSGLCEFDVREMRWSEHGAGS